MKMLWDWTLTIVIIGLFFAGPFYCINNLLTARRESIKQEEVTINLWMPKKCTVCIGTKEWEEKFPNQFPYYVDTSFEQFKRDFENADGNYAVIHQDSVAYHNLQGKVLVSTTQDIKSVSFCKVTETKYLGKGDVLFKVQGDVAGYVHAVVIGLFSGVFLDLCVIWGLFVVIVVACLAVITIKFFFKKFAAIFRPA